MLQKYLIVLLTICAFRGFAENVNRPGSAGGSISGTVVDFNNAIVPGATVTLQCQAPCKEEFTISDDSGIFEFNNLSFGAPYKITVSASGFKDWTSAPIVLTLGRSIFLLTDVQLRRSEASESPSLRRPSPPQVGFDRFFPPITASSHILSNAFKSVGRYFRHSFPPVP